MKFILMLAALIGLIRHPKAAPAPTMRPIPPMPDPEQDYYRWHEWAATYSPWSLS